MTQEYLAVGPFGECPANIEFRSRALVICHMPSIRITVSASTGHIDFLDNIQLQIVCPAITGHNVVCFHQFFRQLALPGVSILCQYMPLQSAHIDLALLGVLEIFQIIQDIE